MDSFFHKQPELKKFAVRWVRNLRLVGQRLNRSLRYHVASEHICHKAFNWLLAQYFMEIQGYSAHATNPAPLSTAAAAEPLDNLLHSKSRLLRSKLEVLASEIYTRLTMWERNLARIDGDKQKVEQLLQQFTRLARYHLRDQNDVTRLHDSNLRLEAQRRDEDSQCWRDVVMVMRDFLETWEAHEQARNRSIFINHVGAGNQESL